MLVTYVICYVNEAYSTAVASMYISECRNNKVYLLLYRYNLLTVDTDSDDSKQDSQSIFKRCRYCVVVEHFLRKGVYHSKCCFMKM